MPWRLPLIALLLVLSAPFKTFADDPNDKISFDNAIVETGVSPMVNGCVNVITGDYVINSIDMVLPGPEPLTFERRYASSSRGEEYLGGWTNNHTSIVSLTPERYYAVDRTCRLNYTETSGRTSSFKGKYRESTPSIHCNFNVLGSSTGLTNCGEGVISARNNPKNFGFHYVREQYKLDISVPSGEKLKFRHFGHKKAQNIFGLKELTKPNSHTLNYEWTREKDARLKSIQLMNHAKNKLYSEIKINQDLFDLSKKIDFRLCDIDGIDGQKVQYKMEKCYFNRKSHTFRITQVRNPKAPTESFQYIDDSNRIAVREFPESRFLKIEYYKEGINHVGNLKVNVNEDFKYRKHRVHSLKAPVGTDATQITTYRFVYNSNWREIPGKKKLEAPGEDLYKLPGYTNVYDVYSHLTEYHYNSNHNLTKIRKFSTDQDNSFYCAQHFVWGDIESNEPGYLQAKYITDAAGKLYQARAFTYDNFGNIIREGFYGNISGTSPELRWAGRYPEANGCECYSKSYTYYGPENSVPHLMASESDESGKESKYIYHTNSELLAIKLIYFQGKILKRYFYDYDQNGTLIRTIEDDGSATDHNNFQDVTERKITRVTRSDTYPYGLPAIVDEYYLDLTSGQEVHYKRTINNHSIEGYLLSQTVQSGQGNTAFTITKAYDAHGNVIRETNPIGTVVTYGYDANNNLIFEGHQNREFHHTYDFSNRRIKTTEIHNDGTTLVSSCRYDYLSNKIATIDPFGIETKHIYDAFNRLTDTVHPVIPNAGGGLIVTSTSKQYDILGNVTQTRSQQNEFTDTTYNIYGKPLSVHYPDGTQESFTYNLNGTLKKANHKNGTYDLYTYDCFDRLLTQQMYSASGEFLSGISNTYNTFHQLTSTDAEGVTTYFSYDMLGRKISVVRANACQEFGYDEFGRINIIKEWYSDTEYRAKKFTFDALDRVLTETIEEGTTGEVLSTVSNVYDIDSNVICKTVQTAAGVASTITEYNSCKMPTKVIDALGNVSFTRYNYNAFNPYGQRVLEITQVDPNGIQTISSMNSQNKPEIITKKNALGEVLSKIENFYGGIGDRNVSIETVVTPGKPDRKVISHWVHDAMHQLRDQYEALTTPEQKHTHINYNTLGQKESVIKPDGSQLLYTYDAKGRLAGYSASDQSFSYSYTYDLTDNLINVLDVINQTNTVRTYVAGLLMNEKLGSGLETQYTYDRLQRPVTVLLPDQSRIEYVYNAVHLLAVKRFSANNELVYTHEYLEYDLCGHATKVRLANGNIQEYTYDLLGRLINMSTPGMTENLEYDSTGNLLAAKISNSDQPVDSHYAYDDTYQLKSESGIADHTYVNDSLYNCVNRDGNARTVNSLNQLLGEGDVTYQYSRNGNRIAETDPTGMYQYEYDAQDRLTTVIDDNAKWQYIYDSFDRRLSKQAYTMVDGIWVAGCQTSYLYQGQNEVGACDSAGQITELRILGTGKGAEIGASVTFEFNGTVTVPIHDHNGNVVMLLDGTTGQAIEQYRYTAFGHETIFDQNNQIAPDSVIGCSWRYASKRVDAETGFVYFGRRYYDPTTQTWLTPDPIGFEGGPNLYAYVLNSPLTHIDLYGLKGICGELAKIWNWFKEDIGRVASNMSQYVSNIPGVPLVGKCISYVGTDWMPVPLADGVIRAAGDFCCGHGLTWNSFVDSPSPKTYQVGRSQSKPGKLAFSYTNGVKNNPEEAKKTGLSMSAELGGEQYNVINYPSKGLLLDLLQFALLSFGIETKALREAKATLSRLTRDNEVVIIDAHSLGGLIAYRALQSLNTEQRSRCIVRTFGSAKLIDGDALGLKDFENHIFSMDAVPILADPIKYSTARANPEKYRLQIHKSPYPFVHSMEEYIDVGAVKNTEIIKQYGL